MRILSTAALIGLAAVMAFASAGGYGIINFDDYIYVLEHPEVTNGLSISGLKWAFTWLGDSMWAPLTWISYMADYSLGWGESGMHWHSIILHGVNAGLLFILLSALFGTDRRTVFVSAFAALLWAIHPLRVESVVWISGRKDELSTLFFLAALICWTKGSRLALAASAALMAVGGMAKASVMILPAFAFGIDLIKLKACEARDMAKAFLLRPKLIAYGAITVIALALAIESGWAQKAGGAMATAAYPQWYALVNAVFSLTVYAGNTLCPDSLATQCLIRYPHLPRWSPLGLLAILLVCWWGYRLVRRICETRGVSGFRDEAVCFAWVMVFFAGLIPFIGLVPFGLHAFADRFTILPSIGLSVAAAFCVLRLLPCAGRGALRASLPALAVLCLVCGALTVRQTGFWKDDAALFGRTLEVDGPSNLYAQVSVGLHYWEIEHDMEKTYQYLSSLMTATPWIAEWYGRCAPYLMEAAYATGRREEAEDAGIWLEKWDRRQRQRMRQEGDFIHETTINALFGETIRLINTEGQLEIAKEAHARLKRLAPRHHLTLEIAWQIAKREGDAIAISNALENCVLTEGDSYSQNRWAAREIARYRR